MTKHAQAGPRPRSRSRQSPADKIWAVGLAGATCVGLVGTIGVRAATDAAAEPSQQDSAQLVLSTTAAQDHASGQGAGQAVSSSGLTEAQLDDYAQALEAERARLEAYHSELLDVAAQLQSSADAIAQSQSAIPASASSGKAGKPSKPSKPATQPEPKPAAPKPAKPAVKPVPKPAAAPQVAAPQAQTRGS